MGPIRTKYAYRPMDYKTLVAYARSGAAFRRWYVQARLIVKRLAAYAGVSPERSADILAITSPRCVVSRNLIVANAYLRTGVLSADMIRATRVALAHYETTGEIRGPKTSAFAAVLKGDNNRVVVDSHMARAFGYDEHLAGRKWVRESITRRTKRLAKVVGWNPAATQAAIWAGYYRATYPSGNVPLYDIRVIVPF